jgi:uncharacterized membrane protein YeaQ/YmgE (transglycosylase-associated protein family)
MCEVDLRRCGDRGEQDSVNSGFDPMAGPSGTGEHRRRVRAFASAEGDKAQMMHFIVWIIVSGFAGFVASKIINKSGSGLFRDIIIGIAGGSIGDYIFSNVLGMNSTGLIAEVIVAILGSLLVVYLWNLIFRRRRAV